MYIPASTYQYILYVYYIFGRGKGGVLQMIRKTLLPLRGNVLPDVIGMR